MTDYEVIDAIVTALKSTDPADQLAQATAALRVVRSHETVVGWRNPKTGTLSRDDKGGEQWEPIFVRA